MTTNCWQCRVAITDACIDVDARKWHPECFQCFNCKRLLEWKPHVVHKSAIFCSRCYGKMYIQRCTGCSRAIKTPFCTRAMNVLWHPKCFACSICLKQITNQFYISVKKQPECNCCHRKIQDDTDRVEQLLDRLDQRENGKIPKKNVNRNLWNPNPNANMKSSTSPVSGQKISCHHTETKIVQLKESPSSKEFPDAF